MTRAGAPAFIQPSTASEVMPFMTANIEDLVRRIAANEAERVMREHEARLHTGTRADFEPDTSTLKQDVYPTRCRVTNRKDERCRYQQGHAQRHRFTGTYIPPHVPPPSKWEQVKAFTLGRYAIRVGSPVRIPSFPKGEKDGWIVRRIEKRKGAPGHDPDQINVEVWKPGSHTRTVKASRLIYVRPTGKAGQAALAAYQTRGL